MPPKKQKELVDERFQAIVLTDSYESRFMPLTAELPRCLLPLANVPLIEYTLEFLARAGVNEVYLVCSAHAEQIQNYIEKSRWAHKAAFAVTTVLSPELRSVGDAMRDLDNRGLISGDFLLVSGDVVTNIDFKKALAFHKAKKAADKDHIVTMVCAQAHPLHRARSRLDPAVFVLDKNSRCHFYQGIPPAGRKSSVAIDPELLEHMEDFALRNDLIDCHVDICSPHVPQIFQENFDYQLLRADFVKGVLTSDLLRKTIYAYITEEYAARVESWNTYAAVSQDVLARWCYPLVPDANLDGQNYLYEANHIYKEKVVLAQLCRIGSSTCIGAGLSIGSDSKVEKAVVGRGCRIGSNVEIVNSYVWDGAVVGDNARLDGAIVAGEVGDNVVLLPGSVVGFGVSVPSGSTVRERLSKGDTEPEVYLSDSSSSSHLSQLMSHANISDDSIALVTRRRRRRLRGRRFSATSAMSTDYAPSDEETEDFGKEAVATVERAMENSHDMDTALLELNTLRMSMNVTYHEVRLATAQAMVNRVVHFVATGTLAAKEALHKVFAEWGRMFRRQVFEPADQEDLAAVLETVCKEVEGGALVLFVALRSLYEADVVEEEAILQWWRRGGDEQVRSLTAQFVDWLENAEEESDDE